MKNSKTIIHEFDPCIYPRLLWVVKGGSLEEIRKTLEFGELSEEDDSHGALTLSAYDNKNKRGGFLVWFPKAKDMLLHGDWVAHEASHVALGIFDYIGAEAKASDSEPFSYLVGWVFKCIDEVRKFKEVEYGRDTSEQGCSAKSQPQTPCEETQENRNG